VCGAVLCCSVVWCGKASHFLVAVACFCDASFAADFRLALWAEKSRQRIPNAKLQMPVID